MRRVFAILVALALMASAAPTQAEIIEIPTSGIRVEMPAGWRHLTLGDFRANFRKIDFGNKELAELMEKRATPPLIGFIKYPEPYEDLNPTFKINIRPAGPAGIDPVELASMMLKPMAAIFPDLKLEQDASSATVSGLKAGYARASYTVRVGSASFRAMSEIWVVPRDSDLIVIGVGLREDERNGTRTEIRNILESVSLQSR